MRGDDSFSHAAIIVLTDNARTCRAAVTVYCAAIVPPCPPLAASCRQRRLRRLRRAQRLPRLRSRRMRRLRRRMRRRLLYLDRRCPDLLVLRAACEGSGGPGRGARRGGGELRQAAGLTAPKGRPPLSCWIARDQR